MASPTYRCQGIVLKKTKLGESDLILTLLIEDGSQVRAVAKGARKPGSFAARLELYSCVDLLIVEGKSLDIIKEVRIVASNEHIRSSLERATCASVMAELLDRVTQVGLEHDRLYALSKKAFATLGEGAADQAPAIMDAHFLKTIALCGFKPTFDSCVICGKPVVANKSVLNGIVSLAVLEGGVVCDTCTFEVESMQVAQPTISWCHYLLMSTFDQIVEVSLSHDEAFAVARVCQNWIMTHMGIKLKALNFFFTAQIF